MAPTLTTVNVTARATLIYGSQGSNGSPLTVINKDTTNIVWVGNVQNIMPGQPNSIPLNPGDSQSFDGSISVYGVTAGPSIVVAVVPGGNSYSPGSLFITGNVTADITGPVTVSGPLDVIGQGGFVLGGAVAPVFQSSGSVNIAANSSIQPFNGVDVSNYNSYDLAMAAVDTSQATLGHALTFNVRLDWFDDLITGIPVFSEVWNPWVMGQTPTHPSQGIVGSGPMHGQYMSMTISNAASFVVALPYVNVFGSPRPIPLSDWRQSLGNHVTDQKFAKINSINNLGSNNVLVDTGGLVAVVAGNSYMVPCGLYSGPVDWYAQVSGSSVNVTFAVCDVGNDSNNQTSGNISDSDGQMNNNTLTTSPAFATGSLFLPRNACAVFMICTGSGNAAYKMTAQQGP